MVESLESRYATGLDPSQMTHNEMRPIFYWIFERNKK